MSNKTRLQTNNANLQSLINKANTLPEAGGGSSGGGVETCTVTITSFDTLTSYAYTAYENNNLVAKGSVSGGITPLTLNNVVCGSAIFINNSYYMNGTTVGGGVEVAVSMVTLGGIFRAPSTAGSLGTIDIYDND